MDDRLRYIRDLYEGDDQQRAAWEARLADDDELRAEASAIKAVRRHLEERPPNGPSPGVIDAVVDRAADRAPREVRSRQDRPARRHGWSRLYAFVGGAMVLLLAVSLGWFTVQDGTPHGETPVSESEAISPSRSSSASGPLVASDDPSADLGARTPRERETPSTARSAAAPSAAARGEMPERLLFDEPARRPEDLVAAAPAEDELPEWEDASEVLEMYRRIELVRHRAATGELQLTSSTGQ